MFNLFVVTVCPFFQFDIIKVCYFVLLKFLCLLMFKNYLLPLNVAMIIRVILNKLTNYKLKVCGYMDLVY